MGIWDRVKASYREAKADAFQQANEAVPASMRLDAADFDTHREQDSAVAARSAAEERRADAQGQTVRGNRAGYMSAEEAEALLVPGEDGRPPLRLVRSGNGLDLAAPDGRLIDYNTPALRHFHIFAFRAVGTSYYENPARPFTFRTGQTVGILREPDNEHDPHAVALTTGRPARTFGYATEQGARWVAELTDSGQHLVALIIQAERSSPCVLITTPEMLASLRRE
jgi:hypothetical protein